MRPNPKTSLKDTLFSRIEAERVAPRSRLFFRCRECAMWSLWAASVLIGSLAVAVSMFVVMYHQYALYEATHDNFLTFIVSVLPYVWFVVFGVMVWAAWYNLRQTKRGYRYSLATVILSSVIVSFAGGAALQVFGFGYTIDHMLGEEMSMYMSQDKLERKLWQNPDEGRLLGFQMSVATTAASMVLFEDSFGEQWEVRVVELFPQDTELLKTKRIVRVLGEVVDAERNVFHACGVFSWMMDKQTTIKDMSAQRQEFVKKVYDQKRMAEDRLALLETKTFSETEYDKQVTGICAEIAAVRRMSAAMR